MTDQNVKITLTGDAKSLISAMKTAGIEVKGFGQESEKAAKGFKQTWGELKGLGGELGLTMGLGEIVGGLKDFGVASIQAAGQAQQLGAATDSLAKKYGESGESMVAAIQSASNGTIGSLDAMQAANKAMMFGLVENGQQMADLTKIAVTLGAAMGQDAAKSFDDLTTALGRQSPMILDNLGITLKLEEAYAIYAAQLGKTAEQLTDAEKKQAFVSAALEKGREKVEELGGVQNNMATQTQAMTAAWSDFQVEFGGALTKLGQSTGIMDGVTGAINALADGAKAWQGVLENNATISRINERAAKNLGFELKNLNAQFGMGGLTTEEWRTAQQDAAAQLAEEERQTKYVNAQLAIYEAAQRAAARAADEAATAAANAAQARAEEARTASQQAAFAQYIGTGTNRERDALAAMRTAAGQMPEKVAEINAPDLNFDSVVSKARSAASDTQSAFEGAFNNLRSAIENNLAPSLDEVWKPPDAGTENIDEAARRLATVSTSGFGSEWLNSLNEQFAGMDFWQPITEAMQSGDEGALKAAANDILTNNVTKLWDIELVKENVRRQLQEQNARQQIVDTIMQEMIAEGALPADAAAGAGMGMLGQVVGDPATVANNITNTLQPAIDTLKGSLAGLAGGGGDAAEGAAGMGGSSLMPLITDATTLDTMFNATLPGSILLTQNALQVAAEDSVIQFEIMQTAATELDTQLTTLASTTLANLKSAGAATADTIKTGMENAAKSITSKLIPAIDEATRAFRRMADAARDAAGASNSAGASAPEGHTWGGGRAAGGPISAGNLYLVGERGPELFIPGSSGYIAPYRDTAPTAMGAAGGGGSLTIGTLILNGVQDVQALFDGIQREAKARGMQFQMVS